MTITTGYTKNLTDPPSGLCGVGSVTEETAAAFAACASDPRRDPKYWASFFRPNHGAGHYGDRYMVSSATGFRNKLKIEDVAPGCRTFQTGCLFTSTTLVDLGDDVRPKPAEHTPGSGAADILMNALGYLPEWGQLVNAVAILDGMHDMLTDKAETTGDVEFEIDVTLSVVEYDEEGEVLGSYYVHTTATYVYTADTMMAEVERSLKKQDIPYQWLLPPVGMTVLRNNTGDNTSTLHDGKIM